MNPFPGTQNSPYGYNANPIPDATPNMVNFDQMMTDPNSLQRLPPQQQQAFLAAKQAQLYSASNSSSPATSSLHYMDTNTMTSNMDQRNPASVTAASTPQMPPGMPTNGNFRPPANMSQQAWLAKQQQQQHQQMMLQRMDEPQRQQFFMMQQQRQQQLLQQQQLQQIQQQRQQQQQLQQQQLQQQQVQQQQSPQQQQPSVPFPQQQQQQPPQPHPLASQQMGPPKQPMTSPSAATKPDSDSTLNTNNGTPNEVANRQDNDINAKRVEMILEMNREIIRLCIQYHQNGQQDPDLPIYQARLQSNLTYLATMADSSMVKPGDTYKAPTPPDVSDLPTPKNEITTRIQQRLMAARTLFTSNSTMNSPYGQQQSQGGAVSQPQTPQQSQQTTPQGAPQPRHQGTPQMPHQGTPQMQHQGTPQMQHQGTPQMQHQTPQMQHQGTPPMQHQGTPQMQQQGTPQMQHQTPQMQHQGAPQAHGTPHMSQHPTPQMQNHGTPHLSQQPTPQMQHQQPQTLPGQAMNPSTPNMQQAQMLTPQQQQVLRQQQMIAALRQQQLQQQTKVQSAGQNGMAMNMNNPMMTNGMDPQMLFRQAQMAQQQQQQQAMMNAANMGLSIPMTSAGNMTPDMMLNNYMNPSAMSPQQQQPSPMKSSTMSPNRAMMPSNVTPTASSASTPTTPTHINPMGNQNTPTSTFDNMTSGPPANTNDNAGMNPTDVMNGMINPSMMLNPAMMAAVNMNMYNQQPQQQQPSTDDGSGNYHQDVMMMMQRLQQQQQQQQQQHKDFEGQYTNNA